MSWRPHPGPQTQFLTRGEFEVLFGGAAGPGKSECLVVGATRRVGNPRFRGLLIRRTFPQLREIIDRCFRYYPQIGGSYRATDHRWVFQSGATIELGHMQHEADRYNYQGREYHWIGVDELTHFTEVQYTYLMSRCRSTDPELPSQMRATTNPGGIGHPWVKKRFVDCAPPYQTYIDPETGLSRAFIPGRIADNPTLIDADPGYLARLRTLPEVERRRLLDGDWESFEGQVFRTLSQRVHGREPFIPPPDWYHFAVMDWGFAKPFSIGWYAVDYDDVVYRYAEWYGCKPGEADQGLRMTALDVAREIVRREQDLGVHVRVRYADPSIFNSLVNIQYRAREVVGGSVAEDMSSQGLHWLRADNDRMHGIQQVHKRFQVDEEVDPHTGEVLSERPRFVCTNNCEAFWRTIPPLQASERDPEDVDTRQEDHVFDELKYAFMSRPLRPRKVITVPSGTFSSERSKYLRARDYAKRYGTTIEAAYQRVR